MNKSLKDMTDTELSHELDAWESRIQNADSWGASLAAADEFRKAVKREIARRAVAPGGLAGGGSPGALSSAGDHAATAGAAPTARRDRGFGPA